MTGVEWTLKSLALIFLLSVAHAETPGYTWKHCERPDDFNVTVPFTAEGVFRPDCAPDVIYSWRPSEVLDIYKKNWQEKKIIFSNYRELFSSRTPLASHGYGTKSIRIKLRDDVIFVDANKGEDGWPNRDCGRYRAKFPPDKFRRIVVVSSLKRQYPGFSEYILCSEGPIASWSYGTPEHLQEMEREYAFIKDKTPDQMDAVRKQAGVVRRSPGEICPDGKDCSLDHLIQVIGGMREAVANGDGGVFYMPGVPEDRAKHFSVKRPGYFQYAEDSIKFSSENAVPEARTAEAKPAVEVTK